MIDRVKPTQNCNLDTVEDAECRGLENLNYIHLEMKKLRDFTTEVIKP